MKQFTLTKVGKMGEYDDEYGQVFWCEVAEDLMPVRFQKKMTDIKVGSKIFAEEVEQKPGNKKPYLQLKKVKVDETTGVDEEIHLSSEALGITREAAGMSKSDIKVDELLELAKENNRLLKQLTGSITEDELSELPDGF